MVYDFVELNKPFARWKLQTQPIFLTKRISEGKKARNVNILQ